MAFPSFLLSKDIENILGCGQASAYSVIRDLNSELKAKGHYVRQGRVSTDYFCERFNIDKQQLAATKTTAKRNTKLKVG